MQSGAALFVRSLEQYGVEYIFGNPGTTELPLVKSIKNSSIDYILGLHEDIAVGMAAGYATNSRYHLDDIEKGTLPLGVVNLHTAPGLAHGLSNIYNASISHVPLLVTVGVPERDFQHEEPILHDDVVGLVDQFTKYSDEVRHVDAMPAMVRRAARVALTPPTGPVFLSIPLDIMLEKTTKSVEPLGPIPDPGFGDPGAIQEVTDLLKRSKDIVLVTGDELARSGREAIEAAVNFADLTDARVYGEIIAGEINFPRDHRRFISQLPFDEKVIANSLDSDTVVFVGVSPNTTLLKYDTSLLPESTNAIHIGRNAKEIGKNKPLDGAIMGDPGRVLKELNDTLGSDRSHPQPAVDETGNGTERSGTQEQGNMGTNLSEDTGSTGIQPGDIVRTTRSIAPEALVVGEENSLRFAVLDNWPFEPRQYIANKGGGLGYSLPAAMGAKLAEIQYRTDREVICFIGDGSFQYYPQAVYTAVKYDIPLTVVVLNNGGYEILKENAVDIFEDPEAANHLTGVELSPVIDTPRSVEGYGVNGRQVSSLEDFRTEMKESVESDDTFVIDVPVG